MAVAYDIKAHPTVYGSRQFRSRLEAKWASFFDQCGWQFEYEPFDLPGWSPDFLLGGTVLVEVKPIIDFDDDTVAKMTRAARAAKWDGELMLLGVSPLFSAANGPYESPAIGWLGELCGSGLEPDNAVAPDWWFGRASACISTKARKPDFTHDELSFSGRMYGLHYKDNGWPADPAWLKAAWDRAANRVQWHKK